MNGEIKNHPTKIDNESFDWMVGESIEAAEFAEPGSSSGARFPAAVRVPLTVDVEIWPIPEAMIVCSKDHRGHQFGLPAPLDASSIVMS